MKLISMIDYIHHLENAIPDELNIQPTREWDRLFVKRTISYMRFLKQPLKLEMFVPCDEEGNVLGESCKNSYVDYDNPPPDQYMMEERMQYKKAKEKVLFEGFERDIFFEEEVFSICNVNYLTYSYLNNKILGLHSVEYLCNSGINLTNAALKQLGLETSTNASAI